MGIKVLLNYDELNTEVKKFRDEGEDVVKMHATMRDRVHDLRKEWIGEAADKFFNEMENELLPALVRLAGALFLGQDVLLKIIKTIQTFDQETAGYFKGDFVQISAINLGAVLAGAGAGAGIGSMLGGSLSGGISGAQQAGVGGPAGAVLSSAGPGDSAGDTGGTGETPPNSQTSATQTTSGDQTATGGQSPKVEAVKTYGKQTIDAGIGAVGGGGGGSSSGQGLQGDLKGMEVGAVGQVGGGGGGGAGSTGGGAKTTDHIYDGSSGGAGAGAGGSSAQTSPGVVSAGGGEQGSAGEAKSAATGAAAAVGAGVVGSAGIGAASKSSKGRGRSRRKMR